MIRSLGIRPKHNRSPRATRGAPSLAILLTTSAALIGTTEPAAATHQPIAHAARSLNGTATAHLHLTKAEGSQLIEEGPAIGVLAGSMRVELDTGALFTGNFTFHTHFGSIKGQGRATPHGSGRYESFSGALTVTGGSGRYAHVNGHAGLYGVFDRRNDSVVVQTTGKLTY
jgi:hypothetical protein